MITIIVEIGTNHMGDVNVAKKIIDIAVDSGADIVKFQRKNVEKIYTKKFLDSYLESPWGNTQRDQKNGLEFGIDQYKEIDKFCKEKKIKWSASAWDIDAQNFINQFDIEFNKVASPMLGHMPLLKMIASEKSFLASAE